MSPSLPVPSKGALRALRQIALGTSCTIAFGAGLITEDRRCRIHSAREVSDNARRIKTSRKYHSVGASTATTFEEQIESYYQSGPWKGGERQRALDPTWQDDSSSVPLQDELRRKEAEPYNELRTLKPVQSQNTQSQELGKTIQNVSTHPNLATLKTESSRKLGKISINPALGSFNQQRRVASQMMEALRLCRDVDAIDAAIFTFFEAFPEGFALENVGKPLLDACVTLAEACKMHTKVDRFIPVLQNILASCVINEEYFYKLQAVTVIHRLLEESGANHGVDTARDKEKLEEAVAIFKTVFTEKPTLYPPEMNDIGIRLLDATFQAEMYDLTDKVFWRMMKGIHDEEIPFGFHNVLLASSKRELHKQVLSYFDLFFAKSKPVDQTHYQAMVSAAVDAALTQKKFDKAEEVLFTASRVAEAGRLATSTTWFLRLLGEHWRTTHDLSSTQNLFDRLEVLLDSLSNCFTVYSAMIQFCVEAGQEDKIQHYIERIKASRNTADLDARTYGHLALAKARRNDWAGVEADYTVMKCLGLHSSSHHTAAFVPILQLYAESHDIGQVEGFLYRHIEELGIAPNEYVLNVMIDIYCKAGELDCIAKWIKYNQSLGNRVDAVTFNTILTTLRKKWSLSFDQLFACCEQIKSIDSTLVNTRTAAILRAVAVAQEHKVPHFRHGARKKVRSIQPSTTSTKNAIVHPGVRMNEALALGMPAKALHAYKRALKLKVHITPWMVAMAVTASMRCSGNGNLNSAIEILEEASSLGVDTKLAMSRLVLVQRESLIRENNNTESIIIETLAILDKHGIEITLPVISTFISMHVNSGRYRQALNLFDSLCSTYGISDKSLDLVILSILLEASTLLPDFRYIKWIAKVLSQNGLVPDKRFKQVLVNARRRARKHVGRDTSDVAKEELVILDGILEMVKAQRSELRVKRKEAVEKTLKIMEMAAIANPSIETGHEPRNKIRMVKS